MSSNTRTGTALLLLTATLSHASTRSAGFLDVTAAPYSVDNTGETDVSDALQKAFPPQLAVHDITDGTPGVMVELPRAAEIRLEQRIRAAAGPISLWLAQGARLRRAVHGCAHLRLV